MNKLLSLLKDAHVPVGIVVFIVGTFVAMHGMMTASYVGFTSTVFSFLAAHHYVENKLGGDKENDTNNQDPK